METERKGRGRGAKIFIWESGEQNDVIESDASHLTPQQYQFMFWITSFYWNYRAILHNMIPWSAS